MCGLPLCPPLEMCIRDRGDIEAVLAGCDVVIDHTYHTRACQQAMMETFRTYCSIDAYGDVYKRQRSSHRLWACAVPMLPMPMTAVFTFSILFCPATVAGRSVHRCV